MSSSGNHCQEAFSEFEECLGQVLEARQDALDEDELILLVAGLGYISCTWDVLHNGVRHRIEQLLAAAPIEELYFEHDLFAPLPAAPIDQLLLNRLGEAADMSAQSKIVVNLPFPDRRLLPKLEQLLEGASNYFRADGVLRWINAIADILSASDVDQIVAISLQNDQIFGSVLARRQLGALQEATASRVGEAPWAAFDQGIAEQVGA